MDVILLQKVDNLGGLGDQVRVKPGYGRNFLIPTGRAVPATAENVAAFEARRAELEKDAAAALATANERKTAVEGIGTLTIAHQAGEEGKLFGSVGTQDIADACTAAGVEILKSEVRLPEGAFREVGEFDVELHLHADVNVSIKVAIVAE